MWIQKGFQLTVCFIVSYRRLDKILDDKGFGGAVLLDLLKAFDALNYELLIAKPSPYGFSNESLKLIQSSLTNKQQRTRINKTFSKWTGSSQGINQGTVLDPLSLTFI